ncbi:MAG: ATP-binding cassette domain-containing protein [Desulfofustis sp.]|nr:ATP-binding cassette domain-containing protein [Desulfofustis sp.]
MLYELNKVTRTFGDRIVLEIDSLSFEARKIYALIGPNGAGKTTLLNQLAFLDQPSSGQLQFKSSAVVYDHSSLTRLRRNVVLVDQSPILFSGSVWRNIEFGLKVRKIPKKERTRRILQALERVTMADFAHRDVHGLSGGEVKRVALARALALEPEVLLCDEPTANVDREHQEIILKILFHANSVRHTTIIFSTHYLSQSRQLAHHTMLLQNGRLSKNLEENIFQLRVVRRSEELKCRFADHLISFSDPDGLARENGLVRVHINPEQIHLRALDEGEIPEAWIAGTIVSLAKENGKIRIVVDIGQKLQLLMSEKQFFNRPYQVLQGVAVGIEAQGVMLLS